MYRSIQMFVVRVAFAVCVWPAAVVQAQDVPHSDVTLTVDQVRGTFASAGFQIDGVHNWDWTSPPVSTVQIHDQSSGRVLMALVYPSSAAAQAARFQAQAREPADQSGSYGPHLVAGFGPSLWHGNVALQQTTQSELDRKSGSQDDCDPGVLVETQVLRDSSPLRAVDHDFMQALDSSAFTY